MTCENFPNQAREDCLRPYNDFFNLYTELLVICRLDYPGGIFI